MEQTMNWLGYALRNLLRNRFRWIKHHYCSMVMALISLTWEIERGPNCSQKQRGVELFLKWAIMQGVAMILQNIYQRQRIYTRIALGKARRMDFVWGRNYCSGRVLKPILGSCCSKLRLLDSVRSGRLCD